MSWLKRNWWTGWLVVGLLLAVSALLYAKSQEAVGEAREADRMAERADSARQEALQAFRRDSAALDSARARERAVRDSLGVLLAEAERDAEEATGQVEVETVALDSTLAELSRRVRPELVGLVTRAMEQADRLHGAHDRYRSAMERRVALLIQDTASLAEELGATRRALTSTREALHRTQDAFVAMTEARNRWRRAADPPFLARLFGENLLEAAGTVGSGALAYVAGEEKGLLGWGLAKGADLAIR